MQEQEQDLRDENEDVEVTELSEDDLEEVAGGWTEPGDGSTTTTGGGG